MAVRYGKAVTKNVLERPMINNFNADIRESMEQQDQELAEKYVEFIRDLYEITDPARIYIEINDQLEQAIYQLQIVLTTKGSGKKTELRKFTRALEELDHFIDTQLTTKLFEEFVENECHTIEGYDPDSSHDKLVITLSISGLIFLRLIMSSYQTWLNTERTTTLIRSQKSLKILSIFTLR